MINGHDASTQKNNNELNNIPQFIDITTHLNVDKCRSTYEYCMDKVMILKQRRKGMDSSMISQIDEEIYRLNKIMDEISPYLY